ncbi:MAG TPA: hypothetical protein VJM82_07480 [Nitrospiraceae bacterium]|nr:hypothetical protein [Nitrospiraceae bacterium]
MRRMHSILLTFAGLLFLGAFASAHEADQAGPGTHRAITGVVTKIQSGLVFVKPPEGLRFRVISPLKADRIGLHEAKAGDMVTLVVDEGNVLVDAHKTSTPGVGHRLLAGKLNYADMYWQEIKLSTPDGVESFAVDTLTGSKLSLLKEGTLVRVELDEDNVMVDIHPIH